MNKTALRSSSTKMRMLTWNSKCFSFKKNQINQPIISTNNSTTTKIQPIWWLLKKKRKELLSLSKKYIAWPISFLKKINTLETQKGKCLLSRWAEWTRARGMRTLGVELKNWSEDPSQENIKKWCKPSSDWTPNSTLENDYFLIFL